MGEPTLGRSRHGFQYPPLAAGEWSERRERRRSTAEIDGAQDALGDRTDHGEVGAFRGYVRTP